MGRFVSEDKVKGNVYLPISINAYLYCWNRPISFVDLDGKWPSWEDVNNWVQDRKEVNIDKKGTITIGINLSGTLTFWQLDGSIGLSIDRRGNIALQVTGVGGVTAATTGSIGLVAYGTVTNAATVYNLEGQGVTIGGSIISPVSGLVVPIMGGLDLNLLGDVNQKKPDAIGGTISVGTGLGTNGELHIEWGETNTLWSINLFDKWDDWYNKKCCIN